MLSGEGNENGEETTICPISKKATLHVQHTFCVHFFAARCFSRLQRETSKNFLVTREVMLYETIRNDDFKRNTCTALQHCYDIVSNNYNIVPTLQRCVALKIVVANRSV